MTPYHPAILARVFVDDDSLMLDAASDYELAELGSTSFEIGRHDTKTGNPFVLDIDATEVTVEWSDIS